MGFPALVVKQASSCSSSKSSSKSSSNSSKSSTDTTAGREAGETDGEREREFGPALTKLFADLYQEAAKNPLPARTESEAEAEVEEELTVLESIFDEAFQVLDCNRVLQAGAPATEKSLAPFKGRAWSVRLDVSLPLSAAAAAAAAAEETALSQEKEAQLGAGGSK
jgi:hypothetical protein